MSRLSWYVLVNTVFTLIVAAGAMLGSSGVHPLYLMLLFAVCCTPLLDMRRLNDRFVLLSLFSVGYFLFYGITDVLSLLQGGPSATGSGILSSSEFAILLGGALVHVGYRVMCRSARAKRSGAPRDWSESSLVWAGGLLWAVCTWLTWDFKVNIVVDASNVAAARGLASLNSLQAAGFILATMLQPLGILIVAYTQCRYRRNYMTAVLVTVVFIQVVMGFVVDVKGVALLGGAIVIATKLLVDGKLPKAWLAAMAIFVALAFPVLQANRTVRDQYSVNRTDVAGNILKTLARAVDLSKQAQPVLEEERSLNFLERMSMKGSVDLIVARTGKDVPFQDGYTLSPLLTAFIPRLIWPDKPDVQTGQVMNREFKVSEVADTYISPSHLGELYWNFGWIGVATGMSLIGLLLGFIGARNDLSESVTLTRVMILVATFQLLILGAESTVAVQYAVWLRSMGAIGLLHLIIARVPSAAQRAADVHRFATAGSEPAAPLPAHPNLMR